MSTAPATPKKPTIFNNFRMENEPVTEVPRLEDAGGVARADRDLVCRRPSQFGAAGRAGCVQVNEGTIAVVVESTDRWGHTFQGVRHVDDPIFEKDPAASRHEGCWDYGDAPIYSAESGVQDAVAMTREITALKSEVAALKGRLDALDKELHV